MASLMEESASNAAEPDPDNNLGRGAPQDREERIRQRAHEIWEQEGRPEGQAQTHWERAAQELDREDAEIERKGIADKKPGAQPTRPPNDNPDPTKT
jgi:hypothetical protein